MTMSDDRKKTTDREWSQRILCSDESCIGTIGPDGRCRECRKRYAGGLPSGLGKGLETAESDTGSEANEAPERDESSEMDEACEVDEACETDAADDYEDSDPENEDWNQRVLCSDENCIGVLGPDGRCKECGKKAGDA
jgi:hypothetical protein